jgi:exodeoxyribonuclease V alpha subunit
MTDRLDVVPIEDPRDRRAASTATGRLRELNLAGVLDAADVHVAQRLGRLGKETDERVLLAAALAVRALRSGSVCLALDDVAAIAPGLTWPEPGPWRAAVAASPLVGTALHQDGDALYLDRYWREESQVVDDLRARAAAPPPAVDPARLGRALDDYFADPAYDDQRGAAETACRQWTTVVTGGPGTGKTTTIARLLGVLLAERDGDQPLRVALAAPTGKAAARMAQAVREATEQRGFPGQDGGPGDPAYERVQAIRGVGASTLHRLLGWLPGNRTRFRHHRENRLPHDVVIVDETSMVSLTMMARLLEAMRPEARLVLVGDSDQLASVDAGAVLKDLVDGYRGGPGSPVSRLGPTRRYGERIGALARAIQAGDVDTVLGELRRGGGEVAWTEPDELPRLLRERAVALHAAAGGADRAGALRRLDDHRLLCAHREGPYGVATWNRTVERLLMEATGQQWLDRWYVGQPLIVNANDYGLDLWNGDTGVICRDSEAPGGMVAVIGDGRSAAGKTLATTRLADVSTAHAMTVHRSQGSQFDEVTVLLPEPGSRILTRELFYTAVTRARSGVRVVGTEESVRAAVTRQAQRATGLARRLG